MQRSNLLLLARTIASVTPRQVTCTVVSVMPYMLTSRGRASPWRSTHGRRRRGSSASPPKTTARRRDQPGSGRAAASIAEHNIQLTIESEREHTAVVVAARRLGLVALPGRFGRAIVLKGEQLYQVLIKCER